ncbi:hypothetical protein ACOME3_010361 [Neoechinorhynchus agilis]
MHFCNPYLVLYPPSMTNVTMSEVLTHPRSYFHLCDQQYSFQAMPQFNFKIQANQQNNLEPRVFNGFVNSSLIGLCLQFYKGVFADLLKKEELCIHYLLEVAHNSRILGTAEGNKNADIITKYVNDYCERSANRFNENNDEKPRRKKHHSRRRNRQGRSTESGN